MISDPTNRGRMSIQKEREDAVKHKSMNEIDTPANGPKRSRYTSQWKWTRMLVYVLGRRNNIILYRKS